MRLVCARPLHRPPPPPFGISAWTEGAADSIGVLLDLPDLWPASGFGRASVIAGQLPDPESLAEGQLVVLLPRGAPREAWLRRLLARSKWIAGAVRGSALLARGYARIGAGIDPASKMDLVWGYGRPAPPA